MKSFEVHDRKCLDCFEEMVGENLNVNVSSAEGLGTSDESGKEDYL